MFLGGEQDARGGHRGGAQGAVQGEGRTPEAARRPRQGEVLSIGSIHFSCLFWFVHMVS